MLPTLISDTRLGDTKLDHEMKSASLFACLPALAPHCFLLNFDKHSCLPGRYNEFEEEPPLPPQAREVFPNEVDSLNGFQTDLVEFEGGLSLLKGRVSSAEIIGKTKTDRIPGKYEGGLKLWECTMDLVNTTIRDIKDGQLSFRGKRVLELGCGHGLPGIFAILKGATTVHFQDFNEEVLTNLTLPNVDANIDQAHAGRKTDGGLISTRSGILNPEVHYYAGDWGDLSDLLSVVGSEQESESSSEEELTVPSTLRRKRSKTSRAFERALLDVPKGGYDIILMSETVYSLTSLPKLYNLIKKCLRPPYGVVYLAAKKHYFGVGGGTRQFKSVVDEDGVLGGHLVTDFSDGSSSVREVWKFFLK